MLRRREEGKVVKRTKKAEPNGIPLDLFVIIVLSMSIVVLLGFMKVYLSSQIYYESRRINYIEREVSALREEKKMLESRVEKMRFNNRVSSTAFELDGKVQE